MPENHTPEEGPDEASGRKGRHWYTVGEAADYLGVSEPTIYRWMREGKLSYYKIGQSTRFRRENLDMVVEKQTGSHEADYHRSRCASCGHTGLVPGRVQSTGRVYFRPDRTRFLTMRQSAVSTRARACPRCGFVQIFADTDHLQDVLRNEELGRQQEREEDSTG